MTAFIKYLRIKMAVVVLYGNFGLKKKYYVNQLYFHRKYIDLLS